MKIVFAAVPLNTADMPPLSLALLTAEMRREGHEARAFDFNIETYHNLTEELKEYWVYHKSFLWFDMQHFDSVIVPKIIEPNVGIWADKILAEEPDLVGLSATAHPTVIYLAKELKARNPQIKIILGGPSCAKIYNHPDRQPCEYFDIVVHNEGETTLLELVREFERGGKIVPVLGSSGRDENGNIVFPGLRPAVMDINQFAFPDFDDFDLSSYLEPSSKLSSRSLPVYTTRGCVSRCNFCMDYKLWDSKFRQKSAARIVEELEYLSQRYNTKQFTLAELIFNGNHREMMKLVEELNRRGANYSFWSHFRIDPRLTVEALTSLKQAGFNYLAFGLEAGNDHVLKVMRKGYNAKTASEVLQRVATAGVRCSVNIVTGFPGESWWNWLCTLWFVVRHRHCISSAPNVTECYAIPGTDIALYPEKFGIKVEPGRSVEWVGWETKDGRNTALVRRWRKRLLQFVFSKVRFGLRSEQPARLVVRQSHA